MCKIISYLWICACRVCVFDVEFVEFVVNFCFRNIIINKAQKQLIIISAHNNIIFFIIFFFFLYENQLCVLHASYKYYIKIIWQNYSRFIGNVSDIHNYCNSWILQFSKQLVDIRQLIINNSSHDNHTQSFHRTTVNWSQNYWW